ncbi:MAG: hypothetical protein NTY12_04030 [Candidatus Falkowbacteria bacterium]|nr:hypothetical protein [Candidatus Falkowbacteria bacterium]
MPKEIKAAVASNEAAARIATIGQQYGLDLATTIMKVMVKEITLDGLGAYFVNQNNLPLEKARLLEKDLRKYIFNTVIDYLLGASAGPKLVFSEADEKEVKENAQPVKTVDFDAAIEEAVVRVLQKSRISLTDPIMNAKFRQVIKTYLRLTRDKIATVEALSKASELGGVALSRDAVDRAMSIADAELNELKKISSTPKLKIPVPEDKHVVPPKSELANPFNRITREAEYNLEASLKAEGKLKINKAPEPIMDASHELAPPVPVIIEQPKVKVEDSIAPVTPVARKIIKDALVNNKPIDKPDLRRLADQTKTKAPVVNLKLSSSGKVKMDDIRFTPQVLSPVDELRYMSLKTFRRLNPDPIKATDKIKEKLEFLGRDDYSKKIQGIVAWQESPLNKMYLTVCRRALEVGKPVTDILQEELSNEPSSLKPEELSAIISLNHVLKF